MSRKRVDGFWEEITIVHGGATPKKKGKLSQKREEDPSTAARVS